MGKPRRRARPLTRTLADPVRFKDGPRFAEFLHVRMALLRNRSLSNAKRASLNELLARLFAGEDVRPWFYVPRRGRPIKGFEHAPFRIADYVAFDVEIRARRDGKSGAISRAITDVGEDWVLSERQVRRLRAEYQREPHIIWNDPLDLDVMAETVEHIRRRLTEIKRGNSGQRN